LFPTGAHDDQVDTFAYAATQILRGMNLTKPVQKPWEPPSIEDRCWKQLDRHNKLHEHPILGIIR
jgi:hypothetical protein